MTEDEILAEAAALKAAGDRGENSASDGRYGYEITLTGEFPGLPLEGAIDRVNEAFCREARGQGECDCRHFVIGKRYDLDSGEEVVLS